MGLGSICGGRERSPLEDPVKNGACLRPVRHQKVAKRGKFAV